VPATESPVTNSSVPDEPSTLEPVRNRARPLSPPAAAASAVVTSILPVSPLWTLPPLTIFTAPPSPAESDDTFPPPMYTLPPTVLPLTPTSTTTLPDARVALPPARTVTSPESPPLDAPDESVTSPLPPEPPEAVDSDNCPLDSPDSLPPDLNRIEPPVAD